MRTFIVVATAALLLGCKPADQASSGGGQQQQGAGIIDTMTQKSKMDAGRRTADKIHQITDDQQKQLDEVMGN